jgi:autotransporter-associated beta strand protein
MNGTGGIHLQGVQNFDIANTTGDAAADLIVSMRLDNPGNAGGAAGGVNKIGSGTMLLNGNHTYTGATTVSAGTLLVNGSLGNTAVTVNPAATIAGTGSLGGSLSFAGGAFLDVLDFNDPLAVTGTITFGSGFGIANLTGIDWDSLAFDTSYTVLSTSQTFGTGDIGNFGIANAAPVGTGRYAYFTNGSLAVVVIPEPAAALLGGLGLLTLLRRRRA